MLTLPPEVLALLMPFSSLFSSSSSSSVWPHAQMLLAGSILTTGQRTVTAALRAVGLSRERHYQNYHRVLNRAQWSLRQASHVLLQVLVSTFVPHGPILLGLDDTIERRRGAKITARGIYRDPVRSSQGHFVKTSGLRWLCLMLLVPISFAGRVWALPFLTALCPSLRYFQKHRPQRLTPKKLTDWARQLVLQVHRWFPDRTLVVVADNGFSVLELLASWQRLRNGTLASGSPIITITRLRLDAALYEPAPERVPGAMGRPRLKGKRLPTLEARLKDPKAVWNKVTVSNWYGRYGHGSGHGSSSTVHPTNHTTTEVEVLSETAVWYHSGLPVVPLRWVLVRDPQGRFEPQAWLCTDLDCTPETILSWYAQRWSVEVTFREVRAHLGVETQRQWNDKAIARTTPLLLGLFSIVTLLAHHLALKEPKGRLPLRQAAWYRKEKATFSDALAWVRRRLWSHQHHLSYTSPVKGDIQKLQHQLIHQMASILCYAA